MKLGLVIPAYNEGKVIGNVLKTLPRKIKGIDEILVIVVNDGSEDDTEKISKKYTKYVVSHCINMGVGAALTTGFEAVKKLNCDIALTFDADGQHSPKDIEKTIQPIMKGDADVVVGSRLINSKGMPVIKIIGNWLLNVLTLLVFQVWTTDSQSGLRVFSKKAVNKMYLNSSGYEISSEMIGEIKRNKLKMKEVAIETIYTDYSKVKGQSIFNGVNILTRLISIRLSGKK